MGENDHAQKPAGQAAENFERVSKRRLASILQGLRLLRNVVRPSGYYAPDKAAVQEMFRQLREEMRRTEAAFKAAGYL